MEKIDNKLDFCTAFGNIARDHLPKVPKNPGLLPEIQRNIQMAVNGKN